MIHSNYKRRILPIITQSKPTITHTDTNKHTHRRYIAEYSSKMKKINTRPIVLKPSYEKYNYSMNGEKFT